MREDWRGTWPGDRVCENGYRDTFMTLDRRRFLGLSTAAAAGLAGNLSAHAGLAGDLSAHAGVAGKISAQIPAPGKPRNILLIIADDQGYDMSCVGTPVKTPVLDRLAGE